MVSAPRPSASIAIIGAGPAGLMAAERLSQAGHRVVVFDRMASAGRKFLMAGRGGLNLTHSESLEALLSRYGGDVEPVQHAIREFSPEQLVAWAEGLGQTTFTGSSGRIFPKSLKASPLLRAWLTRLGEQGVELRLNHTWTGTLGPLIFQTPKGEETFTAAAVVLALGGASWPRLGSNGAWVPWLAGAGIAVEPLAASNCGVRIAWSDFMKSRHCGQPLKRIAVSLNGETRRGEAVVTKDGLEGGVIYALSGAVRKCLAAGAPVALLIDLRPDESLEQMTTKLSRDRARQSLATFLRKAVKLSPPAIALLHEASGGRVPEQPQELARLIKSVPVQVTGLAGLDRAISSAGGVMSGAIDQNFMLRAQPGVFVAGEMLNWDAPTGGYLLQACFATGVAAARGVETWLSACAADGNAAHENAKIGKNSAQDAGVK